MVGEVFSAKSGHHYEINGCNVQILFTVFQDITLLLSHRKKNNNSAVSSHASLLPCHCQIAVPNFHVWYLVTCDQLPVNQIKLSAK